MRPWPVHGLHLADDAFLEIKSTLAPPENLRDSRFPFERAVNCVSNRTVREVNLTVPSTRLESESSAPLPEAAHLQDLGGGKLVEIADQRMAGIDPLCRGATTGNGRNET